MEKNPDPDKSLVLMDPDPGGPKTYGSRSATLNENIDFPVLSVVSEL